MSWKDSIEAQVNRFGIWGTALGFVWGFMSWAASQITPFANLGWGTFAVLGFGAVCLLTLVVSAALAAWRYFNPLPSRPKPIAAGHTDALEGLRTDIKRLATDQTQANQSLSNMIGSVDDKAEKIAINVQADIKSVREEIQALFKRTEQQYELTGKGQLRLREAILAREAKSKMEEADQRIIKLGDDLISAKGRCDNETAWIATYGNWDAAISIVDALLSHWQPKRRRFLDIGRIEYENFPDIAPAFIRKSESLSARYMTACIAQERYKEERKGAFGYFDDKVDL